MYAGKGTTRVLSLLLKTKRRIVMYCFFYNWVEETGLGDMLYTAHAGVEPHVEDEEDDAYAAISFVLSAACPWSPLPRYCTVCAREAPCFRC
jgi:hypothetical protein